MIKAVDLKDLQAEVDNKRCVTCVYAPRCFKGDTCPYYHIHPEVQLILEIPFTKEVNK